MRPVFNSWSSAWKEKFLLTNHPQLYLWCYINDVFKDKRRTDTQNKFFETVIVSKIYESNVSVRGRNMTLLIRQYRIRCGRNVIENNRLSRESYIYILSVRKVYDVSKYLRKNTLYIYLLRKIPSSSLLEHHSQPSSHDLKQLSLRWLYDRGVILYTGGDSSPCKGFQNDPRSYQSPI
jgi:hypothetical protein